VALLAVEMRKKRKSNTSDVENEVTKVDGKYDSNDHWKPGSDVYCKIAEEDGSQVWRKGKIRNFLTVGDGIDGVTRKSKVILKVEAAEKGGEPNTVTVYSDQYGNCLRKVDPIVEFLAGGSKKFVYQMFKQSLTKAEQRTLQKEFENDNDSFDFRSLFDLKAKDHPNAFMIFHEMALNNKNAQEIISKATGKEDDDGNVLNSLAYLVGRIIGIELQHELMTSKIKCSSFLRCIY